MVTIFELCRRSEYGIFAVPYGAGRRRKPIVLPDGAIVEAPAAGQRREIPDSLPEWFDVAHGGVPATFQHSALGLIVAFLPLSGVFMLPNGDVAAVYGADVVPIGAERVHAF